MIAAKAPAPVVFAIKSKAAQPGAKHVRHDTQTNPTKIKKNAQ